MGAAENGNILIGMAAGESLDEGENGLIDSNIAIGKDCFTGGNLNTDSTTIKGNIAIGTDAMNSTGTNASLGQIAIGHEALTAMTGASGNIAIGYQSLKACTTGSQNVAIGESAMIGTDDGVANTAIGHSSMAVGNIGNYNVGVGGQTLVDVTGNSNIAMGFQALFDITTGSRNIAIGHTALKIANGTENDNIAIGHNAMGAFDENGNAGDDNIAIGRDALKGGAMSDNTRYNVAIGNYALDATGTNHPEENVAIGHNSLSASTSGEKNTAIGYNSGDVITTGNNNVIIGNLADPSANSGTNQIVIGYNATGQADNSVTLGNGDVTAVYMASDSGATVHCAGVVVSEGINFPDDAATGHSSDANTLDNYEEGTWTATDGSGASPSLSFTLEENTYVKVGRLVTAHMIVTFPTTSDSNLATLTLPFTAESIASSAGGVVLEQDITSSHTFTACVNGSNALIIRLAGVTGQTNANLSGKKLRFAITYMS